MKPNIKKSPFVNKRKEVSGLFTNRKRSVRGERIIFHEGRKEGAWREK
jgi:hypothetical protein